MRSQDLRVRSQQPWNSSPHRLLQSRARRQREYCFLLGPRTVRTSPMLALTTFLPTRHDWISAFFRAAQGPPVRQSAGRQSPRSHRIAAKDSIGNWKRRYWLTAMNSSARLQSATDTQTCCSFIACQNRGCRRGQSSITASSRKSFLGRSSNNRADQESAADSLGHQSKCPRSRR